MSKKCSPQFDGAKNTEPTKVVRQKKKARVYVELENTRFMPNPLTGTAQPDSKDESNSTT